MCLVALPVTAAGGLDRWTTGSEGGGAPGSAVLTGATGYLGFRSGALYRTRDAGATWARVGSFGSRFVDSIDTDTHAGQPTYVATDNGVFRSFDGGATWAEIAGTGQPGQFWYRVAVDHGRAGTVFFVGATSGQVFRSVSSGSGYWTDVSAGLPPGGLTGMVVDPSTHVAWGWSYGGGVYTLADGDTTWGAANNGLPSTDAIGLAVDSGAGRVIVATTSGAAWLANTGGASWAALNGGLSNTYFTSLTSDVAGNVFGVTINNTIWSLPSGATTWTQVAGGLPIPYSPIMVGDETVAGHALALSPNGPFAPNHGQGPLWRTTDDGASWSRARGIQAVDVSDLAVSRKVPGLVLAATDGDVVQRSTDGGVTWSSGRTGLPSGQVRAIAFDSKTATTAFAVTNGSGTFRSTDGGRSWALLAGGAPSNAGVLQSDPSRPGTVYAGDNSSVWRSQDSGSTWSPLPSILSPLSILAIVPDPRAPGAIFATGYYGIYHLANGGGSWTPSMGGLDPNQGVRDIAFDPRATTHVLAATWAGGVYRSTDGGQNWKPATNGIPDSFTYDVVYDPLVAHRAYASTLYSGVYRTNDDGKTWAPLTGGVALPAVDELRFDADGHTLYGSTHNMGVVARSNGQRPAGKAKLRGKARVGSSLTLSITAAGFPVPKIKISWQRCSASGASCKAIHGAKRSKYKLTAADRGHRLRAVVTLTNALGKTTVRTKPTAVVG
jgi:photosystem II stability/assembly factor-like uncharacterized protein